MAFIQAIYKNMFEAWAKEVFRHGSNVTDAIGRGFRSIQKEMLTAMIERGVFNLPKDAAILLMNDFDLTLTKMLWDRGYHNIYLLVFDTSETKAYSKYMFKVKYQDKAFKMMFPNGHTFWKQVFNVEIKEVHDVGKRGLKKTTHTEYIIEGVDSMVFDFIIANPPYGPMGANITKKIIEDAKFKVFINLEPVVDYLRSSTIWTHLDINSVQLIEGFEGAHVLPSIATFSKHAVNELSYDEFYVETVSNALTHKFFKENNNRTTTISFDEDTTDTTLDFDYRLIFGIKVAANSFNHADKTTINVPGSNRSTPYALNNKLTTLKDYYASKKSKAFWGVILTFASKEERDNAFDFVYSKQGAKFLNALAYSMKRDNYHAREYQQMFPKVDWTRSWTVEEILADYGYTVDEIAKVMADLDNFRGMEN